MSIGAPAFAVAGGVACAPRRGCAAAGASATALASKPNAQTKDSLNARFMSISADSSGSRASVERLALEAPAEPVRRPQQAAHADAVIDWIAARVAGDDDFVAGLQRLASDALPRQCAGAAPFDAPALHLAVLVGRHDVHPRMRIAEHELYELAFDLDRLALVICRRERMVRRGTQARQQSARSGEDDQFPLHVCNLRIETQDLSFLQA